MMNFLSKKAIDYEVIDCLLKFGIIKRLLFESKITSLRTNNEPKIHLARPFGDYYLSIL